MSSHFSGTDTAELALQILGAAVAAEPRLRFRVPIRPVSACVRLASLIGRGEGALFCWSIWVWRFV